ncbi:hypothetical protein ILUMI_20128 [Ignelater luminosus]|uniref:Uncharacterized protein n=1 Tax=Ignelater luminosus TaxID=2038154 RepID=A0A8K0CLJ2_IGNLU|nr:hypothetical protein ILUMI_20128 [Ignelater luminosus]
MKMVTKRNDEWGTRVILRVGQIEDLLLLMVATHSSGGRPKSDERNANSHSRTTMDTSQRSRRYRKDCSEGIRWKSKSAQKNYAKLLKHRLFHHIGHVPNVIIEDILKDPETTALLHSMIETVALNELHKGHLVESFSTKLCLLGFKIVLLIPFIISGIRRQILEQKLLEEVAQEIIAENSVPAPIEEYCTEYDGNYNYPGYDPNKKRERNTEVS